MYHRFKDEVEFFAVYIREAHPTDGWSMPSNSGAGISIAQPKDDATRNEVASECCAALDMDIPLLVDLVTDDVGRAYSAFPDRLFIIDKAGKIAYQGGRGPFGFIPREMEQSLVMLLLEQARQASTTENSEPDKPEPKDDSANKSTIDPEANTEKRSATDNVDNNNDKHQKS